MVNTDNVEINSEGKIYIISEKWSKYKWSKYNLT